MVISKHIRFTLQSTLDPRGYYVCTKDLLENQKLTLVLFYAPNDVQLFFSWNKF